MRAPKTPLQGMRDGVQAQQVFGAGGVANAGPISEFLDAAALAVASQDDASNVDFQRDSWTLTSAGAQTKTLTYVPLDMSEHVYLNGIEQDEGTDWSRSDQTLNVLSPMDARVGDRLEVCYAYLTGLPALVSSDPTLAATVLFRLDETSGTVAVDSSGNGYDGTYYGTPGFSATSLLASGAGHSVMFSGDDRVEIAHTAWMDTSTLSFEAFIKTTATTSPIWDRDVYGSTGNRDRIWASRVSAAGKFEVFTFDGAGSVVATATSATSVNDGVKHHVAATMDGTNIRVYVDGTLEATVAAPSPVYGANSCYLGLGVNRSGGSGTIAFTFVGQIDEAAYYAGTVLTGTQIAARAAQ